MREQKKGKKMNRRKFIQSTSAAAIGLAAVGTATARDKPESIGTDEIGITKAVGQMLKTGEVEKAEKLLDQHNIEYYSTKKNVSRNAFSTQAVWDEDASYLTNHVVNDHDNVYSAIGSVRLKGTEDSVRYTSKAADAMGLTYYNNDWAPVNPDSDEVDYGVSYFEGSSGGPSINQVDYDPNAGAGMKVQVPNEATVDYDANMYVDIAIEDRTDSSTDATPVLFEYKQNSAYSSTLSAVSVSVAGLGISVDLDNAKEEWRDDVTAGPGEFDTTS